jgi:hypothetical protein
LPRLLARPNWDEVNRVLETHFGVRVELNTKGEWTAVDGKTLRGTTDANEKQGERGLFAVTHRSRALVAQRKMSGPKSSEIPAVRTLLRAGWRKPVSRSTPYTATPPRPRKSTRWEVYILFR